MAAATVGMRVPENTNAMSVFGNQSPCGDKVCPAHLWTPHRLVLAAPVLPGYKHHTDARAEQMNKHKDPEPLQGAADLS